MALVQVQRHRSSSRRCVNHLINNCRNDFLEGHASSCPKYFGRRRSGCPPDLDSKAVCVRLHGGASRFDKLKALSRSKGSASPLFNRSVLGSRLASLLPPP